MDLLTVFVYLGVLAIFVLILFVVLVYITSSPPDIHRHDSEKYFINPTTGDKEKFPSLADPATLDLSVIVPAYNEESRLPVMMDETMEYLEKRKKKKEPSFKFEVIVVDDGSKDKTTETALKYSEQYSSDIVRVLTLSENRGKGGAVRLGMFSARGKLLLFADADGASKFSDVDKLETKIKEINDQEHGMAVVCGSRAHMEKDSVAERSLFRTVLMYGFHFLVWALCVRGIQDTQCGFKLLTREGARLLFSNLHVNRWAFDVDMLHIAQQFQVPIAEVAINWQEIDGSKMVPVLSWLQMGKDLLLIRLKYLIGAWKMDSKQKLQ